MKIAIVIEHFDSTRGGAELVAVWLAGQLAHRGHDVHVLCHDAKRRIQHRYQAATHGASHDAHRSSTAHGTIEPETPPGVHIHKLPSLKLSTGIGFRMFGRQAQRWCKRHKPDVVHSITVAWSGDIYHPEAGVYARMQRQAANSRPSPAGAHLKRLLQRLDGKQRTLLALERRAVRPRNAGGPWKIISISPGMTREFREHYNLPESRLFRLDNPRLPRLADAPPSTPAEDRAWFRNHYGLSPDDKVALFVGHDFRRKGLRWAIEAIARTPDWKLLVVGLGKVREYFELAQRLNLGERVKFVGPTRDTHRLYPAGDVLLLPVFYDPAPLVVMEAMGAGLPVISTTHLGSAEIIAAAHAGTIVDDPRNTAALAQALATLPLAGPQREAIAQNARRAAEGLPANTWVDHIETLYTQYLQERHHPK